MKPTYEELQEQLENAKREFRSADITMQNLEAKCEKLAAENAGLKDACGGDGSYRDCPACAHSEYIEAPETPATDAFLAEVRASARKDFIDRIEWIIRNECNPEKTETILNELQSFSETVSQESAQ